MTEATKKPRVKIITAEEGDEVSFVEETPEQKVSMTAAAQGAISAGLPEPPAWVKVAKMMKESLAKEANNREWAMFLYTCVRIGVDPVAKQAYLIPFRDKENGEKKHAIVIGIDGFRAKSKESGKYRGTVGPQWCGDDGVWKDIWIGREKAADGTITRIPPAAARVGIRMEGYDEPVWGTALYDEFVMLKKEGQKYIPRDMWLKMPANQLAKCAEAQAHRKANPHLLGNVYISEELQHMNNPAEETRARIVEAADASPVVQQALGEAAKDANPGEAKTADEFLARFAEAGKGKDEEAVLKVWREVPRTIKDANLQSLLYETGFKPNRDAVRRRNGDA